MRTFRQAVQRGHFALTAELTIKREFDAAMVLRQAKILAAGVDAVQITDNPYAWVQISAVTAASILIHNGIDPIPILTCRDRNRIALQSDLLGLRALGVSSILLTRGHRVPKDHETRAATVFDMTGRELIALADNIGNDPSLGTDKAFLIGTGARAFRPRRNWKAESLRERAKAGAQFLQTQLCFNMDILRRYMFMLVDTKVTWNYSVMVSLTPLPSATTARWLKENMSDSLIPDGVIKRMEQASDPEREGVRMCAELMQEMAEIPGVSGINLMTMGNPETIPAAIDASGLAAKSPTAAT